MQNLIKIKKKNNVPNTKGKKPRKSWDRDDKKARFIEVQ